MAEAKAMTMTMTKKPLAGRLYVKAHGRMSELEKMLKEEEPIDNMLWCIMYVLLAHSMLLLFLSSFSANSSLDLCKIWQNPYVRIYLSVMATVIVAMLLYAFCHVIAQAVRMWKEKDNQDWRQWEKDLYLSPQPLNQ